MLQISAVLQVEQFLPEHHICVMLQMSADQCCVASGAVLARASHSFYAANECRLVLCCKVEQFLPEHHIRVMLQMSALQETEQQFLPNMMSCHFAQPVCLLCMLQIICLLFISQFGDRMHLVYVIRCL
jgi:hypothetical protein